MEQVRGGILRIKYLFVKRKRKNETLVENLQKPEENIEITQKLRFDLARMAKN